MRRIKMETWPRREHFEFFSSFDHPHFGMSANVDITAFYPAVKERGHSINTAIIYVLSRVANAIPEFRYRIHQGGVVEYDVVHPATTIMAEGDAFTFCYFDYTENFPEFVAEAAERADYYREHPTLQDQPGRDDYLFMTAIPWVSFTSFMHPIPLRPGDSVPRFAWGKFFEDKGCMKMPLQIQGHHALMDGVHVGRFYVRLEDALRDPDSLLGER